MNPETHSTSSGQEKICQNCKTLFVIEPDPPAMLRKAMRAGDFDYSAS
ncbi:MAG: hypothetical protein AAB867_00670 [Patescibacteria group bacterium]